MLSELDGNWNDALQLPLPSTRIVRLSRSTFFRSRARASSIRTPVSARHRMSVHVRVWYGPDVVPEWVLTADANSRP